MTKAGQFDAQYIFIIDWQFWLFTFQTFNHLSSKITHTMQDIQAINRLYYHDSTSYTLTHPIECSKRLCEAPGNT